MIRSKSAGILLGLFVGVGILASTAVGSTEKEKPSLWSNLVYRFVETFEEDPLHAAARRGRLEDVRRWLAEGSDPNQRDSEGFTPLHLAAWKGATDIVALLIDSGAEIDAWRLPEGETPLLFAIQNNCFETVTFLLQKGADPEATFLGNPTPLALAAQLGHERILLNLLESGVEVDQEMIDGRTALFCAAAVGQIEAASLLVDWGADLEAETHSGHNPLFAAAYYGQCEMVEHLLGLSGEVDAEYLDGHQVLLAAVSEGHSRLVGNLLDRKADPNGCAQPGDSTLLHLAAQAGHEKVANLLIERGAVVDAPNWRGMTPLHYAFLAGQCDLAELLLANGADSGLGDLYGMTPSQVADPALSRFDGPLHRAVRGQSPFDPFAILPLFAFVCHPNGFYLESSGVAFAIGDGTQIVTAAHCVDAFIHQTTSEALFTPFVFSHFYGDLVEVEVVSHDPMGDVALLQAPWSRHPGLALAGAEKIDAASEFLVAGYPSTDPNYEIGVVPRQVCYEKLSRVHHNSEGESVAIVMGGGRHVGPGWSGSPILFPRTGKVAGVFGSHNYEMNGEGYLFHDLMGSNTRPILRLLGQSRANEVYAEVERPTAPPRGADRATNAILDYLAFTDDSDPLKAEESLSRWLEIRPDSLAGHLLLAWGTLESWEAGSPDSASKESVEQHLLKANVLSPDHPAKIAGQAMFLSRRDRHQEALEVLEQISGEMQGHLYFNLIELRELSALDATKAISFGESLATQFPEVEGYWFEMAGILRDNGHYQEGLEAIQKAIASDTEPNSPFRPRLANLLAHNGRHQEAEKVYDELLQEEPDNPFYWLWYAEFLADHPEGRQEEARTAFERSCAMDEEDPMISEKERGRVAGKIAALSDPR